MSNTHMSNTHTLRFLGTGASCGVPSFYCGCKACEEALRDERAQRGCAGLLIAGAENTLIDASPDLRMQLSRAQVRDVARVLVTHEHFDHIGGLPQLEFYVHLRTHKPVPVYAGGHTLQAIAQQFAFMAATLAPQPLEQGKPVEFDGVRYTALPATHGKETFGFIIEAAQQAAGGAGRVAYFPDTGPLEPQVEAELAGIDTLIIDATFYGNNWMPKSHHTVDEAIALAQKLGAKHTWLTHLSMHYDEPLTAHELNEYLAPYNGAIKAAYDGLTLEL